MIMFKLPICPYCHTVYDYREVKKNKKAFNCYHCKNKIKIKKVKGYICLFILICLLAIVVNTIFLKILENLETTIIPLYISSLICVLTGFLLTPFFTVYAKEKTEQEKVIPNEKILDDNKKLKRSQKSKVRKNKI